MNKMYKTISDLCDSKNITIGKLATDLNVRQALFSDLKRDDNRALSVPYVEMVADYFGVSTDYIIKGKDAAEEGENEINDLLEELRSRSEMRMLFSITKGATKEDIEKAVKIIEALREK